MLVQLDCTTPTIYHWTPAAIQLLEKSLILSKVKARAGNNRHSADLEHLTASEHRHDRKHASGFGGVEFKIQTSTYDASYGRNPGANVNVVTKSGTCGGRECGYIFSPARDVIWYCGEAISTPLPTFPRPRHAIQSLTNQHCFREHWRDRKSVV